jgi:hypothetical protein
MASVNQAADPFLPKRAGFKFGVGRHAHEFASGKSGFPGEELK